MINHNGLYLNQKGKIVENIEKKLVIWDTTRPCRFKPITSTYLRGADGIIFVYDTNNPSSFQYLL